MNNYLDSQIKHALKEDILIPESYFNNISSTIDYCVQNESKLRKKLIKKHSLISIIQKLIATVIVLLTCATVYAVSRGNIDFNSLGLLKLQNNYEDNKIPVTNEKIENDYFTLSIESIARDSVYTIVEYKLTFTPLGLETFNDIDEFGNDDIFNRTGFNLYLFSNAYINNSDLILANSNAISKLSDTEYEFIQTINTIDYPNQDIELSIWLDKLSKDNSEDYLKINKLINISIGLNSDSSNSFKTEDHVISDTETVRVNTISNSKFETCIDLTRITHNVTVKEYNDSLKLYEFNGYALTDENNNSIKFSSTANPKKIFDAESNKELSSSEFISIDENTKIRVEERSILILDKSVSPKSINIYSSHYNIPNERTTDEKQRFFEYDWYDLKPGKTNISFTSPGGGVITIDNIEITDDTIELYYSQSGVWLNGPMFSIRKNNGKFSYYSASKVEKLGVDSLQNKATFYRVEGRGVGICDYTDDREAYNRMLIDMDNLQFSVYDFAYNYLLSDVLQVAFPGETKESTSVNKIEIQDTKTTVLKLNIYSLSKKGIDIKATKYEDLEQPNFTGSPMYTTFYEVDYNQDNKILNTVNEIYQTDWYWFESLKDLSIYKNNATGLIETIKAKFEKAPEKAVPYEIHSDEYISQEKFKT